MEALAIAVVLLLVGPLVIIVPAILILLGIAVFSAPGPRLVTKGFRCPFRRRRVTAEFVVPEGAARPLTVISCTAFKDPKRIRCRRPCLPLTEVRWSPPPGVFGRRALISGGVVGPDGDGRPGREAMRPAA